MSSKYFYLAINVGIIILPLILSFDKRVAFFRKFDKLLISISMTSIVFLIWDYYFTEQGIWGFNERYLIGNYIGNLPIEEILFFFTVPYACVFIYEVIKVYTKEKFFVYSRFLTMILMIASWMMVYEYNELAYTRTVFAVLGLLLFVNLLSARKFLMNFYVSYIVMLIPFFIVNGILTGTGLKEAIVWYNGYEHLGIRLLSIPLEDIFYGMALILMNITIYESIDEID